MSFLVRNRPTINSKSKTGKVISVSMSKEIWPSLDQCTRDKFEIFETGLWTWMKFSLKVISILMSQATVHRRGLFASKIRTTCLAVWFYRSKSTN